MAGDWIAFECATLEKPEVYKLARMLGVSKADAILLLLTFWVWIDRNLCNATCNALVTLDIDELMRCPGFAKALEAVGWLELDDANECITIPGFDIHHGKSAKKRLLTARRVAKVRQSSNAQVTPNVTQRYAKGNAVSVTNALPTEQKSIKPSPDPLPTGTPSNGAPATEGQKGSRVLDKDAKPKAETRKPTDPWPRRIPEIADQHGLDLCARAYGIDVRRKHFASYAELQSACFDARNQLREQGERETATGNDPRH